MAKEKKYSPMMAQYIEMKKQHPDEIVFYRLGDFYEMFFEDAKIASSELDLVLTAKSAGVEEKVPMCGIPYHAAQSYITRLIQKGYKVAIVEQVENPATAKGIVKRDLLKVVTPGTIMDEVVDEKSSTYIAGLHDYQYGLAVVLCEMTTGELQAQLIDKNIMSLQKVLLGNQVVEIVVNNSFDKKMIQTIQEMGRIVVSYENNKQLKEEYKHLLNAIEDDRITFAFSVLTNYLDATQRRSMAHLKPMEMIYENEFMKMDYNTKMNLELVKNLRSTHKENTLFTFMDHCKSAMGSRLLKKWIEFPLIDVTKINQRLDAVEYLNDDFLTKGELKEHLSSVYDMERLCARVAYGNANARDILRLSKTLEHAPTILSLFNECNAYPEFKDCDVCHDLYLKIKDAIVDNPPLNLREGGVFVEGYSQELDELRNISKNGKQWILDLEQKERERTGIKSLKIGYNRVFGYYIEVTNTNLSLIKDEYGYIRKQTLTSAERFITDELKKQEDALIHAQERAIALEQKLFQDLLTLIKQDLMKLHHLANVLSTIDALYSLACVSSENGYCRPNFHEENNINIDEGRHPILDAMSGEKKYISNDLKMKDNESVLMITGPNMGGKSTYMRQNALIIIMAQIGCYVPARSALLPVFDAIFTRIGASDDIMAGQSTFMMEMMEANYALQNATSKSFILFDEIGRGTSTYDGMALAQAMLEYIIKYIKAKTLFSTHYHELTQMEDIHEEIVNSHVDVHEENDHITFLYRMVKGKADKSYGINVARLAHLPDEILLRSKDLLEHLESNKKEIDMNVKIKTVEKKDPLAQEIIDTIEEIDVNKMTPMEAMTLLYKLKSKVEKR